jgi:hypothetical protein
MFRFDGDTSQLVIYYGYQFGFDKHLDNLLRFHPAWRFNCGLVEETQYVVSLFSNLRIFNLVLDILMGPSFLAHFFMEFYGLYKFIKSGTGFRVAFSRLMGSQKTTKLINYFL